MALLPIRENRDDRIGLGWVVGRQVQTEVMQTTHVAVHKKFHTDGCAITWFDGHRTDGWSRRSTPFQNFNVRRFGEPQGLVANIGDLDYRTDWHAA